MGRHPFDRSDAKQSSFVRNCYKNDFEVDLMVWHGVTLCCHYYAGFDSAKIFAYLRPHHNGVGEIYKTLFLSVSEFWRLGQRVLKYKSAKITYMYIKYIRNAPRSFK